MDWYKWWGSRTISLLLLSIRARHSDRSLARYSSSVSARAPRPTQDRWLARNPQGAITLGAMTEGPGESHVLPV